MGIPKVSIIVPCYNQAQYLDEALNSVLQQTYTSWECIIVNDGSTDDTEAIAKTWANKKNGYSYVTIKNKGLSNARNVGIKKARGKYILPLDADDIIDANYIEKAIEQFDKNTKLKIVYCKAKKFGVINKEWELKPFSLKELAKTNMIFCSALFKKEDWEEVGGYDSNMLYGFEDWEFWINILKRGGEVYQIPEYLFFYRIKETSMFKEMDFAKKKYLYNYLSLKHTQFFIDQLGSFIELEKEKQQIINSFNIKLKSEKNAINTLTKYLFGINLFKN
jgi:glycosyltransferase involved in cell wall biosynthesis